VQGAGQERIEFVRLPDGFVLRRARVDDAAEITRQRREMFREMRSAEVSALDEMEARFLPWVAAKLTAGEYLGWFAVAEDGTIAAGAGLWLMEWPPHMLGRADRRGYLLNVYTGARFRRRGMAKVLVEVAVDWCRTNGIDVMVLHASNAGRSMYEQLGFAATNEMRMVVK
jgi:GNAT superfamily N-acetyltransferase